MIYKWYDPEILGKYGLSKIDKSLRRVTGQLVGGGSRAVFSPHGPPEAGRTVEACPATGRDAIMRDPAVPHDPNEIRFYVAKSHVTD